MTTAKSKNLKRFRASLSDFMTRLIENTHPSLILYDDVFSQTFQTWLVAATSSRLRSFRHTATAIALDFVTGLCKVAEEVAKEFNTASRQRNAEAQNPHANKKRLEALEESVAELHSQKLKIEEYLKEMFVGVFVHRYRDAEPSIRCECAQALGQWMQIYPEHYLDGDHLRYMGWNLTDVSKEARLAAVDALKVLYAKPESLGSMQHFTERFKARLVEMACGEPILAVRKAALACLKFINTHGLLEEEQQVEVARLIFHVEDTVRHSVANFYTSLVEEAVAEGQTDAFDETMTKQLWLKSLAYLLSKHAASLDENDADDAEQVSSFLPSFKRRQAPKSRVGLAVDALWTEAEPLHEWEEVLDYLLLDHSGNIQIDEETNLDESLRLSEADETTLVEVVVAILARVKRDFDKSTVSF